MARVGSRAYVGVHYPRDVLLGAAIGAGIGATSRAWLLRAAPEP